MSHALRPMVAVIGIVIVLAGCDTAAPSRSATPQESTAAASPFSSAASPAPTPTAPPDPAIGWISPAGDRIVDYDTQVSVTTGAPDLRRVVFTVRWKGGSKTACTSAKPDTRGRWACTANFLALGVPPGSVELSARAFDTAEHAIKGAADTRSLTYAVAPSKPGKVTWKVLSQTYANDDTFTEVDRVTWTAPNGYATEFRLYGVAGCPNESARTESEPCLVEHTPLDASKMKLVKKVDGSVRSMKLRTVKAPGTCHESGLFCSPYRSLVLGAFNANGHSVYAIVATGTVCYECYDGYEGP